MINVPDTILMYQVENIGINSQQKCVDIKVVEV